MGFGATGSVTPARARPWQNLQKPESLGMYARTRAHGLDGSYVGQEGSDRHRVGGGTDADLAVNVMQLFLHEDITPGIRRSFAAYFACHDRPVHEVLFPALRDISAEYDKTSAEWKLRRRRRIRKAQGAKT